MSSEFVRVAAKSEIPQGQVRVFEASGKRIALCRTDKDEVFAVADVCTHDNGPLGEGELWNHQIECPRHGARFDIQSGKAMCLPAILPIPTYPIELRNDEIWVGLPVSVSGA